MPFSRRSFLRAVGAGSASAFVPYLAARGSEARSGLLSRADELLRLDGGIAPTLIRLDSNENPNGPAAAAIDAIRAIFGETNRYPDNPENDLREAVARARGVKPEQVLLGAGSGEILRMATERYTSRDRHLVSAAPTFENPAKIATRIGAKVRAVPVDTNLGLDLDAMARESSGAGLVFFCNPNNPTGTVHGADATRSFISRVLAASPETTILVDEAYFEYVADPGYKTMIPLALENPRVVVARTFSKVFGLAGVRVGYAIAHQDTIAEMEPLRLGSSVNVLGAAAARASLDLTDHVKREQDRNRESREFAVKAFNDMGFKCAPTHTNFVMVDIHRDVKAFQDLCRTRGVAVGRPFPPLLTHLRVSMGTMDEMKRAMDVVKTALKDTRTDSRGSD